MEFRFSSRVFGARTLRLGHISEREKLALTYNTERKTEVSKKYIKEVLIRKTDPFFAKVCLPNLDSKEGLQQVFRDPGLGLFKGRDPRILSQK